MLIGRKREKQLLLDYYHSSKAELVAVYGRRRVGKTYLIRETFENQFFFYYTGTTLTTTLKDQLRRFTSELVRHGALPEDSKPLMSWSEGFNTLAEFIQASNEGERKVIFFDEMPWLDSPRSGFLAAFEYFWNSFASARKDVLFIICGSAASWISNNLFKQRGGLHNRVTGRILLKPFTLLECEEYLQAKGRHFDRYDLIECYMVLGGIPYYLDYIDKNHSLAQNIDRIVFADDAPLKNEFTELFHSLFGKSDMYIAVVSALSQKRRGMLRSELVKAVTYPDGKGMTEVLDNLELSGFIRKYNAFPNKSRGSMYQLVDNFSLFHFDFLQRKRPTSQRYWSELRSTPTLNSWRGYAFEMVCLKHIDQIEQGLGISGILTSISSWRSSKSDPGAQVDLVIERDDRVINLCEIKFSQSEFEIDKSYAENLRNKLSVFQQETKTRKTVFITMITTYGIKQGQHSSIVRTTLTMDDLFLQ